MTPPFSYASGWLRKCIYYVRFSSLIPVYLCLRAGRFPWAWALADFSSRIYLPKELESRSVGNAMMIVGPAFLKVASRYRRTQILLLVNRRLSVTQAKKNPTDYLDKMIFPYVSVHDSGDFSARLISTRCMIALTHTGDHFVSITTVAKLLANSGLRLIVPITVLNKPMQDTMERLSVVAGGKVQCVGADRAGVLAMLQAAKDPNCRIAVFYDLSPQSESIAYDVVEPCMLLGRKAYMASGIWRIAERLGWPVLYGHGSMDQRGYHLHLNAWHEQAQDAASLMALGIAYLEQHLLDHPDSWLYLANLERFYQTPVAVQKKHLKAQKQAFTQLMQRWRPAKVQG
jgi:predicted LPLAT superfamily acyltransferase